MATCFCFNTLVAPVPPGAMSKWEMTSYFQTSEGKCVNEGLFSVAPQGNSGAKQKEESNDGTGSFLTCGGP